MPALLRLAPLTLLLTLLGPLAHAGPLRDLIKERMQERQQATEAPGDDAADPEGLSDLGGRGQAESCEQWARKVNRLDKFSRARHTGPTPTQADIAYGSAPLEKLDVYQPPRTGSSQLAPVVVMVHGGGWCVGDKQATGVTENKVARWVPKGLLFVSVNYPMVSDGANALRQANHVAKAIAYVQAHARDWGGDPGKVVLMGHSAGAHLVSLVNADAQIRQANGVQPVLGTVSLDAGAMNVVTEMPVVYPFLKQRYLEAFGSNEAQWVTASPYHLLNKGAAPWLGVCSTQRKDDPCGQARAYADKSQGLGIRAAVLPQKKNHGAINKDLGEDERYTQAVEAFMATLDPGLATLLRH